MSGAEYMWLRFRSNFSRLELATVGNLHLLGWLARLGAEAFQLLHNVHAIDHRAENHMLAIQPRGLSSSDEKLRSIGVRT